MPNYRLVPEGDWERAMSALESATAALQRCGRMLVPDMPSETRTASPSRRRRAASRARAGDRLELAREVVDRVDAGGPRHVPKIFDRSGPTISDFVMVLTTEEPFKISNLIDPLRRYVELKEARRAAAGQVRPAVAHDSRFRRLDAGIFQKVSDGQ